MNQTVKISRGDVVGMGRIKISKTPEFSYEIPMFSFLVLKDADNSYVSSCIHLQLDGYGKTDDAAVESMASGICNFLKVNFTKLSIEDAWLNLMDLCHTDDPATIELWNAYHDVQFNLASEGIPTDNFEKLQKKITELESENTQLKKELSLAFDYTPIRQAA
jgi:hypothetical protein